MKSSEVNSLARTLSHSGWSVIQNPGERRESLPIHIAARYPIIPASLTLLLSSFQAIVSPDEKSWFLCCPDYNESGQSAYRWNEWEILALEATGSDRKWQTEIKRFWDSHLPFFLSVGQGYAFFAIRLSDGAVVMGREPEFEETTEIAKSFDDFLRHFFECYSALLES